MENSELIKNFERVRDYMRQFYVYGFRSREEYSHKSPRSYDNERRRLESWLGKYMSFRREESGKQVFLSMDALSLAHNPLYQAFRAKSFTDKDITLHFYILDALGVGEEKSLSRLTQALEEDYLSRFPDAPVLEMNTLRKKLKEYHALGLVRIRKQGKELLYSLPEETLDLQSWEDALHFFSEASPLGVIGAFLLDRFGEDRSFFRFKHHYLVHTLDSQILCRLLTAATRRERVTLTVYGKDPAKEQVMEVLPCRVHISAQSGRQYLLGYVLSRRRFRFFRLDTIHKVASGAEVAEAEAIDAEAAEFSRHLWGVAANHAGRLEHLEMTLHVEPFESFIPQRLLREKRCGQVEQLDESTWRFTADVYDALEMLPWVRTFIGRIQRLECSNPAVTARFREDLKAMEAMYGED